MSINTGIAWTRSTRNFWSGCTKTGPGCDGCYAESFQRFVKGKNPETGQAKNWGPGAPRDPHLEMAAKDIRRWNKQAGKEREAGKLWHGRPGFWPVFLNTQSDFFDNEIAQDWRDFACAVIEECTNLTFFIVTKRIGNAKRMVPERWMKEGFPTHVRVIATIVNKAEAERDIGQLLALPCKNGISYEPALEWVDFSKWLNPARCAVTGVPPHDPDACGDCDPCLSTVGKRFIEWIIIGGESDQRGHKARGFARLWAIGVIALAEKFSVAIFMKQFGSAPYSVTSDGVEFERIPIEFKDRAGADPAEWEERFRVQQIPV